MSDLGMLEGSRLRIGFRRLGDRIGHVIQLAEAGSFVSWLESVEGTADEAWPASPPLQEAHFERRDGGIQVALLVGMAGQSHWSVSMELNAAGDCATFDAACRVRSEPRELGSRYQPVGQHAGNYRLEPSGTFVIGERLHVRPDAALSSQARDCPAGLLAVAPPTTEKWPATIRWKYSVYVA